MSPDNSATRDVSRGCLAAAFGFLLILNSAPLQASANCRIYDGNEVGSERLLESADCFLAAGNYSSAIAPLQALASRHLDDLAADRQIDVLGRLGGAYLATGEFDRAYEVLTDGIRRADSTALRTRAAPLLNDLGRTYMALEEPLYATAAFADAQRLATSGRPDVAITAQLNFARAALPFQTRPGVERQLSALSGSIDAVDGDDLRGRLRLSLGKLYRDARVRLGGPPSWRDEALAAYETAAGLFEAGDEPALESRAIGLMGELYEDDGQLDAALRLSREAALLAQRTDGATDLYQWQWQSARILRAIGKNTEALAAYRLAAQSLADARPAVVERSASSFRQNVAPLYFQYADLLLTTTPAQSSPEILQNSLSEARDALEALKVAEIENYFQDDCAVGENLSLVREADEHTAILYPVIFPDRVELLLDRRGNLTRFQSPVGADIFGTYAKSLRYLLEDPTSGDDFRYYAELLYDIVVRPVETQLSSTDTLVVVPGGALRTIPIAVLNDGDRFLVEKYAIVTSLGMKLTESGSRSTPDSPYVQVNGLAESVRGFPPLPHVYDEIDGIAALYTADINKDRGFVASSVSADLADRSYDFVHIATHGQFHRDRRRSYLLTHDELLTMDRLEDVLGLRRYVSQPVDLLFLSACQTAVGDDQAALGLAGVAVKSGARSVVASLWLINDESTARLVSEFYTALRKNGANKAEALRSAQLSLLRDPRYSHPNYWAPFLLVGNWR